MTGWTSTMAKCGRWRKAKKSRLLPIFGYRSPPFE
jgi:hypothetical protein